MKNRKLLVICLIMFVNAVGLSMIVPIMYPLAKTYGLAKNGMGMLIATFSVAQMIAAPFLGNLSDRFGRKPILLVCLLGSAASFLMIAFSNSLVWLFVSRVVDGITGGNAAILNTAVADISDEKNKIKSFGYLSASFSAGILFGPAISGYLSVFYLKLPFLVASAVSVVAFLVCLVLFEDDKTRVKSLPKKVSVFNFHHFPALYRDLGREIVILVSVVLLLAICQFTLTVGFQTFNYEVLSLTPKTVAISYLVVAACTTLMQIKGITLMTSQVGQTDRLFSWLLLLGAIALLFASQTASYAPFLGAMLIYYVCFSIKDPMLNSYVSKVSTSDSRGMIFGVNQSFNSLGQIIGLLTADLIITVSSIPTIFIFCSVLLFLSHYLIRRKANDSALVIESPQVLRRS